jgi:uncharacterized protein (TIGR02145 family)
MKNIIYFLFTVVFLSSCTPGNNPNTFTDIRDGNVYRIVTIGDQVWMAQNLAYLPSVNSSTIQSLTDPHYYVYWYDGTDVDQAKGTAHYQTDGVLYNRPAALTACPAGWHLPTDTEWTSLTNYLGGEEVAGGKLKEAGIAHWASPNEGATNESGFTALPGAYFALYNAGSDGYWWTSTEQRPNYGWGRYMSYAYSYVLRDEYPYNFRYHVRCIKD